MKELLEQAHLALMAMFPGSTIAIHISVANYGGIMPLYISLSACASHQGEDFETIASGRSIAELMESAKQYAERAKPGTTEPQNNPEVSAAS